MSKLCHMILWLNPLGFCLNYDQLSSIFKELYICLFSYFVVHFDASTEMLPIIKKDWNRNSNIVKSGFDRREEFRKPCLDGQQCLFGDIPDPLHEKKMYKQKTTRKLSKSYMKPTVKYD